MIAWYLCPYDTVARGQGLGRRCGMMRYVPVVPNAQGARWEEAETLGNHCLVKLDAPPSVHAAAQADADFLLIPLELASAHDSLRTSVRDRLVALGFSAAEVAITQYSTARVLTLLTSAVSDVTQAGASFTWTSGRRRSPKSADDIEARVAGS